MINFHNINQILVLYTFGGILENDCG